PRPKSQDPKSKAADKSVDPHTPHCLTSSSTGARITVYLASPTNPEAWPLPVALCHCCAAFFLPVAKMAGRSQAHYSRHRRHGPAAPEAVHGRRQDAEFFLAGAKGIVSPAHYQHSAAEPGGVVEPDHGHECGRTRHLRL